MQIKELNPEAINNITYVSSLVNPENIIDYGKLAFLLYEKLRSGRGSADIWNAIDADLREDLENGAAEFAKPIIPVVAEIFIRLHNAVIVDEQPITVDT